VLGTNLCVQQRKPVLQANVSVLSHGGVVCLTAENLILDVIFLDLDSCLTLVLELYAC
jgi:hypothetical protein